MAWITSVGAFLCLALLCCGQTAAFKNYVLRDLGCWKDKSSRAIASIDDRLQGSNYQSRPNAIQACANAASILGHTVFAVQHGGWCASASDAMKTYKKYGESDDCASDGKGGPWANQVYEIDTVLKVNYRPVGCFKDTSSRAIPTIEGRFVDLYDKYAERFDALGKCARNAASLGHRVFAVQDGGWCATSPSAQQTYKKYGESDTCGDDGEGGPLGNAVYEITKVTKITLIRKGCYQDRAERAMPLLERKEVLPGDGVYTARPNAIERCVRYASGFGLPYVGIQNGGSCAAGPNYNKYGASTTCENDSKGGSWGNEVFQLSLENLKIQIPSLPIHRHYYLNNLGCWTDNSQRPTLVLLATYKNRKNAIQRCAQEAASRGFHVIGVQDGGKCFSGVDARNTYRKYGTSTKCHSNGRGGTLANQVYEIDTVFNPVFTGLGCYRDTSPRAIQSIENTQPSITGDYKKRSDAIRKCARAASGYGYKVFAVQDEGWCASSANAEHRYAMYGPIDNCGNGKGGALGNAVYKILDKVDFYIEDQGCWADDAYRTISPVEAQNPEFVADPDYKTREDALAKCARYAYSQGFTHFALQDGGWCVASADGADTYKRIGPSQKCHRNGKGGPWANQVYAIVPQKLPSIA